LKGSHIRERTYNLIVPRVPVIFDPKADEHFCKIEEFNGLAKHMLSKVKWIKPIKRRRLSQTHAYAIFSFRSPDTTNTVIRDGLNICNMKVRLKKHKQEPIQCLKCRRWDHFVVECKVESNVCRTCSDSHCTNTCNNKEKVYCILCENNSNPSQDRNCPELIRRSAIYNEHNPENAMPYFPKDQNWTLVVRPDRILLEERFPAKFVVNSLPMTGSRYPTPALCYPKKAPNQNAQRN
jgi:hypothetical protein